MKSIHSLHSALIPCFGGLVASLFGACVPSGSAPPYDAGPTSTTNAPTFRPSLNIMTEPFEDDFERPDAGESVSPMAVAVRDGGTDARPNTETADGSARLPNDLAKDAGQPAERSNLGPNWIAAKTNAWKIENGKLCGQNAHNHGVWLNRTLPVNARIEFDATAGTDHGDLKAEVWGDGVTYATGDSYTNASSYLAILGGWKNTLHVLARLNEHGEDRRIIRVDKNSDDPSQRPVQKGQTYHFKIERTDGKTVRWSVDGVDFPSWNDPAPLKGEGHDHFGFNEWEAKVCFDNVKVTPL